MKLTMPLIEDAAHSVSFLQAFRETLLSENKNFDDAIVSSCIQVIESLRRNFEVPGNDTPFTARTEPLQSLKNKEQ